MAGKTERREPKAPSPSPCACGRHCPRVLGPAGARRVECAGHLCWRGPVKMDAETAVEHWDIAMKAAAAAKAALGDGPAHWWLRHGAAKIDFTGDQFGGPAVLVELAPGREADAARRVGEALRPRMAGPAGNCFDCSVAAGVMLAAEGVPTRLCRGTVGPGGRYREESVHGVDFESLAGLLGLLGGRG